MSCNSGPGATHHTGCACWEARRDAELAEARGLAGRIRAAWLVIQGAPRAREMDADGLAIAALAAALREHGAACESVPADWEPGP